MEEKKFWKKKFLRKVTTTPKNVSKGGTPHIIVKYYYKIPYIIIYNIYYKCIFYP